MRNLDTEFIDAHHRFLHERTRELATLQRQSEIDQLRRVRINLIEGGLRRAVAIAPDAFEALDYRAVATRIVDELL